jgi:hypothetical protein
MIIKAILAASNKNWRTNQINFLAMAFALAKGSHQRTLQKIQLGSGSDGAKKIDAVFVQFLF